jgi:hypothetical protein
MLKKLLCILSVILSMFIFSGCALVSAAISAGIAYGISEAAK